MLLLVLSVHTAFYGDGSKLTGVAAAGSGGGALDITSVIENK